MGLQIDVISSSSIPKKILDECFGAAPTKTEASLIGSEALGVSGYHSYRCTFDVPNDVDHYLNAVERFCMHFKGDAYLTADNLLEDLKENFESEQKGMKVDHFALGAWTGLSCFIEKFSQPFSKVRCSFFHDRTFLEIYFTDKISQKKELNPVYKLRVAYDDIKKIVLKKELRFRDAHAPVNRKKEPTEVFLHVTRITAYRWRNQSKDAYASFFDGEWDRSPSFGPPGGPKYCSSVGAATVLKFKLEASPQNAESLYALIVATGARVVFTNVTTEPMEGNPEPLTCDKGSADVKCALSCIHSVSPGVSLKIALDRSSKELQQLLAQYATEDDSSLVSALYDIYYAIPNYPQIDMKSAIENAYQKARSGEISRHVVTKEKLPDNLYFVKKVTVCPGKIIYEPPTVVRVNVLLHELDPERVMLVDIRDDGKTKLRFSNQDEARVFIQKSIAEKIKRGIKLAGKTYFFLGNSKSQMDDFSFWAYAIDKKGTETISSVRERLRIEGDLATKVEIQDMVFADALGCIKIDPEWVTEEDQGLPPTEDFKLGIGRISRDALGFILDNCYPSGYPCSALRVIHGGRKGTLVYDPTLIGNQIIYRKSQIVFASKDQNLYLIETNEQQEAVLNRVFISTLSSKLDGHEYVFSAKDFVPPIYELLNDMVTPFLGDTSKEQLSAEAMLPHIIRGQSLRRYDRRGDGLFRQAIRCKHLKVARELGMLKERIKGAYELMPVVDDVGVLEEGEVFIQLAVKGGDFNVLNSPVILARKDAMHPGEILRVETVDRPEVVSVLGHLSNCVVVPSKGRTRLLGVLSRKASFAEGSNLIVIANTPDGPPRFLFKKNDKPESKTVSMGSAVDPSCDLQTHFFKFLEYASYNDFDEAFCAWSDFTLRHAYSEGCLEIASQRRLLEEHRRGGRTPSDVRKITLFPDFLGKVSEDRTYCSDRPLGHIYRKVRFLDLGYFEETQMEYRDITSQPQLILDGIEAFEEVAERDLLLFKKSLEGIASAYQVSVDEVLTGTIFSLPESRFSEERVRSLETTVKFHVQHLATLCRQQFEEGMGEASEEANLQKISAYYAASRKFPEKGGYAFPWMLPDLMQSLIKIRKPKAAPIEKTTLIRRLLEAVSVENQKKVKLAVMRNIFDIFETWLDTNKKVCALARGDSKYFSDQFTRAQTKAFENAFRIFEDAEDEGEIVRRLIGDPLPLLAETLRQMMLVVGEEADKKFSQLQISMMHIQTLLFNTLLRIAALSSLRVLLRPEKILRDHVVSHRILVTLKTEHDRYIQVTHSDLLKYQEKLRSFGDCKRVKIRTVPLGENGDCSFEEFIAKGTWFAVANLEYVIMQPDFRTNLLNIFDNENQREFNRRNEADAAAEYLAAGNRLGLP